MRRGRTTSWLGDRNKTALDDKHFVKPNRCPMPTLPACMSRIGERLTNASPHDVRQPSCLTFRLEWSENPPFWFAETDCGILAEACANK